MFAAAKAKNPPEPQRRRFNRPRGRREKARDGQPAQNCQFEAKQGGGEVVFGYDHGEAGIHQFFTVTVPYFAGRPAEWWRLSRTLTKS